MGPGMGFKFCLGEVNFGGNGHADALPIENNSEIWWWTRSNVCMYRDLCDGGDAESRYHYCRNLLGTVSWMILNQSSGFSMYR